MANTLENNTRVDRKDFTSAPDHLLTWLDPDLPIEVQNDQGSASHIKI
jgi:hypothetical protein